MPQISPTLSVDRAGVGRCALAITDVYGHPIGRAELRPDEARKLSILLRRYAPIEGQERSKDFNPDELTKTQLVRTAAEDFGILLDPALTKAELVAQFQAQEASAGSL